MMWAAESGRVGPIIVMMLMVLVITIIYRSYRIRRKRPIYHLNYMIQIWISILLIGLLFILWKHLFVTSHVISLVIQVVVLLLMTMFVANGLAGIYWFIVLRYQPHDWLTFQDERHEIQRIGLTGLRLRNSSGFSVYQPYLTLLRERIVLLRRSTPPIIRFQVRVRGRNHSAAYSTVYNVIRSSPYIDAGYAPKLIPHPQPADRPHMLFDVEVQAVSHQLANDIPLDIQFRIDDIVDDVHS